MAAGPTIDERYLTDTLLKLMAAPTDVPLGSATLMEPDHPKLVHYVQEVLRPELYAVGAHDLIDAGRNNLIARIGRGTSGHSLLLLVYTVTQHHNLMENPYPGWIGNGRDHGYDVPCAFGQGVSQNKLHQAVILTVLKLLRDSGTDLAGRLYLGINNEGRSSHLCSELILGASLYHCRARRLCRRLDRSLRPGIGSAGFEGAEGEGEGCRRCECRVEDSHRLLGLEVSWAGTQDSPGRRKRSHLETVSNLVFRTPRGHRAAWRSEREEAPWMA